MIYDLPESMTHAGYKKEEVLGKKFFFSAFYRAAQSYLAYNSSTKAREIQKGLK